MILRLVADRLERRAYVEVLFELLALGELEHFAGLADGLVQAIEKAAVVLPFLRAQAVPGGIEEAVVVFVAVGAQEFQPFGGGPFAGDELPQLLSSESHRAPVAWRNPSRAEDGPADAVAGPVVPSPVAPSGDRPEQKCDT